MSRYHLLDQPDLMNYLFYPRRDYSPPPPEAFDFSVEVEQGISISCRLYAGRRKAPWLLYFHGNGEVVYDYDDLAPYYKRRGINLAVTDYRGYGSSSGIPSFESLIKDAHPLFSRIKEELAAENYRSDLWVMGRSLGSIPALELAYHHPGQINGLLIESGFISLMRLTRHLGIPFAEEELESVEEECLEKVRGISIPALVIHGEFDNLVPLEEGEELYEELGSRRKELQIIRYGDHNNVMYINEERYFGAIQQFLRGTRPPDKFLSVTS